MGSISVPINNNSKVQPGWIYLKDEQMFYPSKDKEKAKTENTPCVIEVKELNLDELNRLSGLALNNYWREDVLNNCKSQSSKIIFCMIRKTKVIKSFNKKDIDYEYAKEIYYYSGIVALLKFYKKYVISLEKIEYLLNQRIKGKRVWESDERDALENIQSVYIYSMGLKSVSTRTFYPMPYQAFRDINDIFNHIRKNDYFESMKAMVKTLPPNVSNHSVTMCAYDNGPRKSLRNRSFLRKLWNTVAYGMGVSSDDYSEEIDSDNINSVKDLVNMVENNLCKTDYATTYQSAYCNNHLNSLGSNIAAKQNALNLNVCAMSNNNIYLPNENKSASPSSVIIENKITQADTPLSSINSTVDVPKPSPGQHFNFKKSVDISHEAKIEQTKMRDHETGTRSQDLNAPKNCNACSEMADEITGKLKKNKNYLDSSKDAKKISVKLQPAHQSVVSGFIHNFYYGERSEETGESSKKTLLLFGTDDCGKLSLLNLLFHCSQLDENVKTGKIVDVDVEVKSTSFYHFLSHGAGVEELIVIITPKLTATALKDLKQLLSDGILNVNALGFVVNSRSETLTSEERSFFHFIRSSFGEVSNHHLMTFLSFCDFSRNFPVLEEMKQQSIKSKCTLELFRCELDILEPDDNWNSLIPRELKKGKKVFKTLQNMPLLSVKSMKMAQEKSFAETHCADSRTQLVEELEQFVTLVKDGKEIKENVKSIWRLAQLVSTLEGNESSEKNLLDFVAKLLAGTESNGKGSMNSSCFLLLLLSSHERNFTTTLLSTLDYFHELIFLLHDNSEAPPTCSVLTENNQVALYCNNCRDIHCCNRDTKESDILYVKCLICNCSDKSHSLWTFHDSKIFVRSLCDAAKTSLRDLYEKLRRKELDIQFPLFLGCLSQTYPKYEKLLKTITENTR